MKEPSLMTLRKRIEKKEKEVANKECPVSLGIHKCFVNICDSILEFIEKSYLLNKNQSESVAYDPCIH